LDIFRPAASSGSVLARRHTGVKNGTGQGHHGPPDRWGAQPQGAGQLARAAARRKIAQLEEALEGAEFFTPAHAALLAKVLARIDRLSADIEDLTEVIDQLLAPYEEQLAQAESMPGWGRRAAQDAVAETGVDMSRFHPGAHLSSWVGRLPGQPGLREPLPARRGAPPRWPCAAPAASGAAPHRPGPASTRSGLRRFANSSVRAAAQTSTSASKVLVRPRIGSTLEAR